MEKEIKWVTKKTWNEFRKTGLLLLVNQFLHLFGWAIVFDFETFNKKKDTGKIKEVYPARVKFRGFDPVTVGKSYIKITNYLKKNVDKLLTECKL